MAGEINNIEQYLSKIKMAAEGTFKLINVYNDLINDLKFIYTEDELENPTPEINENLKKEYEYINNLYSKRFLCGSILQFAFVGIKRFSRRKEIPNSYSNIPNMKSASQFIVGRQLEDIHLGLIIYIGRNQWAHHLDKKLWEPSVSLFKRLATWYSPTFKKYYINPFYNLDNDYIKIFASNLIELVGWYKYLDFEKDMLELSKDF